MKIVYIADDGTEFNDEYDCRDYEWTLERKEAFDLIEFYDADDNKIKNIMTQNAYDKVWTIVVPTAEAAKAIVDLGDYKGFSAYLDICSAGTWEWHEDGFNGCFVRRSKSK